MATILSLLLIMGTAAVPKFIGILLTANGSRLQRRTFENRNPADTRDVVGIFQRSGKADVEAAVDAAKRAFKKWRLVPARAREIVYRAAEMLMERKEDYARDMTREMGKILKETRGDVQEPSTRLTTWRRRPRMFGPTTPSELPNKFAMACAPRSASAP